MSLLISICGTHKSSFMNQRFSTRGCFGVERFISKKLRNCCCKRIRLIILGIETSCDETAASICHNGKILSNVVSRQIIHSKFGGVVPEIASREHELLLNTVVNEAIVVLAKCRKSDIDAIAVTQSPQVNRSAYLLV